MASEPTTRPVEVTPVRLWFGIAAAFLAWHLLGVAEMLITWRACLHKEAFGNATSHPGALAAAFGVTGFLMALTATGGFLSYRTWRSVSTQKRLYQAEGRGRKEYMALLGVLMSVMLGAGMVWMLLPLFILRYCARVR